VAKPNAAFMARASLIDRLIDRNPRSQWEAPPFRTLSREELKESVRRDLEWLLNTRTSLPGSLLDDKDLTVIDYGIPDFGFYSPANPDHQKLLAQRIRRSISVFEPRLQKVQVTVEPEMPDEKTLVIHIDAVLVVELFREPVSFQTVLQGQTGRLEIHETI
jgi:type VI secretion system protein ImpF